MKVSIKFRDDEQSPLVRAKIPLSILNFPFQSAISAGEPKDLALSLSTYFDSGPSVKVSYRPKDSDKPFSLVFKTGVGPRGSPKESPLIMSAELNVIGTENPSFFIRFKPDLGDFFLNKLYSSYGFVKRVDRVVKNEVYKNGHNGYFNVANGFSPVLSVNRATRGTELGAFTTVSVRDLAVVNFRWGLRSPAPAVEATGFGRRRRVETTNNGGWTFGRGNRYRLPHLVMNKIGIEPFLAKVKTKDVGPSVGKIDDVAEASLDAEKQNEAIREDNTALTFESGVDR